MSVCHIYIFIFMETYTNIRTTCSNVYRNRYCVYAKESPLAWISSDFRSTLWLPKAKHTLFVPHANADTRLRGECPLKEKKTQHQEEWQQSEQPFKSGVLYICWVNSRASKKKGIEVTNTKINKNANRMSERNILYVVKYVSFSWFTTKTVCTWKGMFFLKICWWHSKIEGNELQQST